MNRFQAIMNGMACLNYLATYHPKSYVSMDITACDVSVHICDYELTEQEVRAVADKLDCLRMAGSELRYFFNDELGQLTFTIQWSFWQDDDKSEVPVPEESKK